MCETCSCLGSLDIQEGAQFSFVFAAEIVSLVYMQRINCSQDAELIFNDRLCRIGHCYCRKMDSDYVLHQVMSYDKDEFVSIIWVACHKLSEAVFKNRTPTVTG